MLSIQSLDNGRQHLGVESSDVTDEGTSVAKLDINTPQLDPSVSLLDASLVQGGVTEREPSLTTERDINPSSATLRIRREKRRNRDESKQAIESPSSLAASGSLPVEPSTRVNKVTSISITYVVRFLIVLSV